MSIADRYPDTALDVAPPLDLLRPAERQAVTPSAVQALVRLAKAWGLTVEQVCALLGDVPPSTWHAWVGRPPRDLGLDRLVRVSYLLGIYSALHVLYPRSPLADAWVSRPNTNALFDGRRPIDMLVEGGIPAMDRVRALLDARRGAA